MGKNYSVRTNIQKIECELDTIKRTAEMVLDLDAGHISVSVLGNIPISDFRDGMISDILRAVEGIKEAVAELTRNVLVSRTHRREIGFSKGTRRQEIPSSLGAHFFA